MPAYRYLSHEKLPDCRGYRIRYTRTTRRFWLPWKKRTTTHEAEGTLAVWTWYPSYQRCGTMLECYFLTPLVQRIDSGMESPGIHIRLSWIWE